MMRSRFVYYLFASVLLHALILIFPFSVTMGGLGNTASALPVRVHLLSGGKPLSGEGSEEQKEAEQEKPSSVVSSVSSAHNRPVSATAPQHTRPADEIEKSFHSTPVESEDAHRPLRQQQVIDAQKNTKQSPEVVRRKETTTTTLTPPQIARKAPTRKAAKKKPTVLRTTTVYRGSRSPAPSPRIDADERGATQTAPRTTKIVTGPQSGGNPEQAHSGRLTHVRYAKVVKPEYPKQARAQGWQGTTVLNVLVNQAGKSAKVLVYRTSGFNLLDDAAVNAMRRWEFYPARNGPQAVPSWVRVPIVFKLEEEN